jgi:antitoxin ParD1/3/4
MDKFSISLPDDLLNYIDQKVDNRSALIESLLKEWQEKQQNEALPAACAVVDELQLGWEREMTTQIIIENFSELDPWTQSLIGVISLESENTEASYIDYLEKKYI